MTLRKLQEQVRPEIDFWAPSDVARLFLAMVARMGLERLLDHAIGSWIILAKPGHEIFERDRWRCTAPACSARRNLHRHRLRREVCDLAIAGSEAADRELEDEIVGSAAPDANQPIVLAALVMPGAERRQVPRVVGSLVGAVPAGKAVLVGAGPGR